MNRLAKYFQEAEEPQEPEVPDSYAVVETAQYWFIVAPETARRVERLVTRWLGSRWLVFTDIYGVRRRILRSAVDNIYESTPTQRAAMRAFRRARKLEEKADRRPWEDDD